MSPVERSFTWLVSYPKSGNTWVRILLTNYRRNADEARELDRDMVGPASHLDRHRFDETMGLASADIPADLLTRFRREYHQRFSEQFAGATFTKVHEAYCVDAGTASVFPASPQCKVVYIIRNPLDIAPSFAHHDGCTIDQSIARMADPAATMNYGESFFSEHLGSWSDHVEGWTGQSDLNMMVLRYEDLLQKTDQSFADLAEFCGLEVDRARITRAVESSRFERLRQTEAEQGFGQKPAASKSFFRKGKAGSGMEELSPSQVERIKADHGAVMRRFGYL